MRTGLIVVGLVLVGVALYLFKKFTEVPPESVGKPYLMGAVACLAVAAVCGVTWFLTKPKESMEDISITKF
jgi:hypothetical protein